MSLVEQLRADLRMAMKARDSARVNALRTILSALDNATAVEVDTSYVPLQSITPDVPRREVSEAEQRAILRAEADGRRRAIEQYEQNGKKQEAARLQAELDVFAAYLE
jgi:uncharacterized protein YqeY